LGNFKVPLDRLKEGFGGFPLFYPEENFQLPSLWLGPKGSVTPLHVDGLDNFAFHISGSKKWTICSVLNYPNLGVSVPFPSIAPNLHVSSENLRDPKVRKRLETLGVVFIEITLYQGDVLYLPAGWFHFVETLDSSLMVNFWLNKTKKVPAILS
jgi:ribosomal protein L16 Arg81 hydroxylase